jgi:hypothetical protein
VAAEIREYRTRDISLAAYLAERDLTMLSARRNPQTGHFEFVLNDPMDQAESLAVEWSNSCCRRHEQRIMSNKALIGGKSNGNGKH